ncbi:hypothetical protein [Rheinheimera sp.]|uniref:hypothetical protein n=1 Tax=Rheinheimera sp. TaxID=1869214 RepID=UPI004048885E
MSVAHFSNLRMFNDDLNDGFFSQIIYVSTSLTGEVPLSPLFVVHFFRFLIVLPFFVSFTLNLPAIFDAVIFLIYLSPFLASRNRGIFGYLPVLFLFFPLLFSYRTVLGMFGMAYLYICVFAKKPEYRLFVCSALLANLSSGIVLSWGVGVVASLSHFRKNYRFFDVLFIIVCLGFIGSVIHKYEFMFSSKGAHDNGNALERSTLMVSYLNEQYVKFLFYIGITSLVLMILTVGAWAKSFSFRRWMFFLGAVPVVFFEGIGLVSYLICIILLLFNNFKWKRLVLN